MQVQGSGFVWLLLLVGCFSRTPTPGDEHTDWPDTGWSDQEPIVDPCEGNPDCIGISSALAFEKGVRPKNLLWITVDTMRWDYYNALGYTNAVTTPNIDRILNGGVLLSKNRACASWTAPSFVCALSGKSQGAMELWPCAMQDGSISGLETIAAGDVFPGIATYMKAEGFSTGLATGNGFLNKFGMDAGYDEAFWLQSDGAESPEGLTDKVLEWVDGQEPGKPWFYHVHYMEPHLTYINNDSFELEGCPADFVSTLDNYNESRALFLQTYDTLDPEQQEACMAHIVARYESEIRVIDAEVGRWLDAIDEDTLVVYFTDHGEGFHEHHNEYSTGWFHGSGVYDEMLGTVAAFYQPGNLKPANVENATSLVDIVPTTLALMGIETEQEFSGRVVDLETRTPQFHDVYRLQSTFQAVSTTKDKLIYTWKCLDPQYFDLQADPGELNDLYDPAKPRVAELWALLRPKVEALDAARPDYTPCLPY